MNREDASFAAAREKSVDQLALRLAARSGFPTDHITRTRLVQFLSQRASVLQLASVDGAADRALTDHAEYTRVEAHFSPPETWLFRYPESAEWLRAFAAARQNRMIRALVVGAGGWSEPCSIAAALAEGAGIGQINVRAFDRNPEVFALPPRFAGLAIRGRLPNFATRWFEHVDGCLSPSATLRGQISVEALRVEDVATVCAGATFDVIACRNVAIYQTAEVRDGMFRSLEALLAVDGVMLVGHAELAAASGATGLAPTGEPAAFALSREASPVGAMGASTRPAQAVTPRAARAAEVTPRAAEVTPRAAEVTPRAAEVTPRAGETTPRVAKATPRGLCAADAAAHLADAEQLEKAGRQKEALIAIRRALYLDPRAEHALLVAARVAESLGDHAGAARFRDRALRVHLDEVGEGESAC